jgi:hypothetical protein
LIVIRKEYVNLRKKVEPLVALIPKDIPGLTVHDITHLDALWETGSTIAGGEYPINPAEAYVLGAAILPHDAGMALAAYPGASPRSIAQQNGKTTSWHTSALPAMVRHHRIGRAIRQSSSGSRSWRAFFVPSTLNEPEIFRSYLGQTMAAGGAT